MDRTYSLDPARTYPVLGNTLYFDPYHKLLEKVLYICDCNDLHGEKVYQNVHDEPLLLLLPIVDIYHMLRRFYCPKLICLLDFQILLKLYDQPIAFCRDRC